MPRRSPDHSTRSNHWFTALVVSLILASSLFCGCGPEKTDRTDASRNLARWEDRRVAPHDSLVSLMTGADAHLRLAAVRTAGLIGRTDVLSEMIAALEDPSDTIRRQAAFSLGLLGDERAVPALTEAYSSPRASLREAVLAGLARLPNDGQALLAATASSSAVEVALAWDGLRNVVADVDSSALRDAVLSSLTRPETDVQWRVLRCLERFPVNDLESLIAPFARSKNDQVRSHAYRALARMETPAALQTVLGGWDDHERFRDRHLARVQINALRALGTLAGTLETNDLPVTGREAVWNDLAAVLIHGAGSPNPHVSETALVAMSGCVRDAPLPPEAAQQESLLPVWRIRMARAALAHMEDEPLGVRVAAVAAWADLRGAGAAARIADYLSTSDDSRIRASLLRAIGRIHADPLPLLVRYSGPGHEPLVREAALTALVHVWTDRPEVDRKDFPDHFAIDPLIAASGDADFVVATTAATLLGEIPSAAGVVALCDLWSRAAGPDRSDLQLGVLAGLKTLFAADGETDTTGGWNAPDSLRSRTAAVLRQAFDSPDIRIRLEARTVADESGLLPEKLIPTAASLRATLPTVSRDPRQPAVAVPGPAPKVRCVTDRGEFIIKLDAELAPNTCAVFLDLIARGYYEDLIFHRVVPDFVVQGGDPRGDGWGGPGYSIRSEWSAASYRRAAVGIAHSGKDTGGSQFFVTLSEQPHLNGRYTVFGEVVKGMDIVDRIQIGDRFRLEVVTD